MKEVTIGKNDAGQRLDKFLFKTFPDLPASILYKSIRLKRIKVGGKRAAIGQVLCEGDRLQLYVNDEFLGQAQRRELFHAVPKALEIVYEDQNLLLLDKPAGLLCHEDQRERRDTLVNRMLRYLYEKGEYDPAAEQSFTPALCNRIDRNTGGLVIAAKTAAALREMDELLRSRGVEKQYLCIALGRLPKERDLLRGYHTKDEAKGLVKITPAPREGARTALTEYRVLDCKDGLSLLLVTLHTGRTHQIRAHLAAVGHPLLGDTKYGTAKQNERYGERRQMLCSFSLRFPDLPQHSALHALSGRRFQVGQVEFLSRYFTDYQNFPIRGTEDEC